MSDQKINVNKPSAYNVNIFTFGMDIHSASTTLAFIVP